MLRNQMIVTHAYHFLCEILLVFLLMLPIFHHKYLMVPYWSYLLLAVGTCAVFTLMHTKKMSNMLYFGALPVLFITLYLLNYPVVFTIILPIIFVWRFVFIKKYQDIRKEKQYLLITCLLGAINIILINDPRYLIYVLALLLILFAGFMISHYVSVHKNQRQDVNILLGFYFAIALFGGAGIFSLLSNQIFQIAIFMRQTIIFLFSNIITGVANTLSFLDVEQQGWPEQEDDGSLSAMDDKIIEKSTGFNMMEVLTVLAGITFAIFLIVFILFAIDAMRKRKQLQEIHLAEEKQSGIDYFTSKDSKGTIIKEWRPTFSRKQPNHPIRKAVYQFERKAKKKKWGRKPSETIEDWLGRIGFEGHLDTYQKVRYGDMLEVSYDEVNELRRHLQHIEQKYFKEPKKITNTT